MIWRRVVALLVFSWSFLLPAGWAEKRWVRVAAVGFWGFGLLAVVLGVVMLGAEYDPKFGEWFRLRWVAGVFLISIPLGYFYYKNANDLLMGTLVLAPGMKLPGAPLLFFLEIIPVLLPIYFFNFSPFLTPPVVCFPIPLYTALTIGIPMAIVLAMLHPKGMIFTLTNAACFLCYCMFPMDDSFLYGSLTQQKIFCVNLLLLLPTFLLLSEALRSPKYLSVRSFFERLSTRSNFEDTSLSIDHRGNSVSIFLRYWGQVHDYLLNEFQSRGLSVYWLIRRLFSLSTFVTIHTIIFLAFDFLLQSRSHMGFYYWLLPYLGGSPLFLGGIRVIRTPRKHEFSFFVFHSVILSLILSGIVYFILQLMRPEILSIFRGPAYITGVGLFLLAGLNHIRLPVSGLMRLAQLTVPFLSILNAPQLAAPILLTFCLLRALYIYRAILNGDLEY